VFTAARRMMKRFHQADRDCAADEGGKSISGPCGDGGNGELGTADDPQKTNTAPVHGGETVANVDGHGTGSDQALPKPINSTKGGEQVCLLCFTFSKGQTGRSKRAGHTRFTSHAVTLSPQLSPSGVSKQLE